MKKRILLFTAIAGFVSLGISSYHNGAARNGYDCTGAETAGTGSFVNSTGCMYPSSGCHATAANTNVIVGIELDSAGVPTTHYVGGGTYTVKITGDGTATANSHYGFQLSALQDSVSRSSNTNAGTWAATGLPAGTQKTAAGSFTQLTVMEQSGTQTGTTFSKSCTWTAPAAGTGTISFWGVANFVDNDGNQNSADVWNTSHVIIHEWPASSTTSLASATVQVGLSAFPNPVTNSLTVQMNNTLPGKYTLQVFDMSGRSVQAQTIEVSGISSSATINTSGWAIGSYHVVVTNGNERHDTQVVKL
jgi:hypothetical protein